METARRIQVIKDWLKTLNELAAKLNKTIQDEKANTHLLGPVRNKLNSVETELVPWAQSAATPTDASMFLDRAEFELSQSEAALNKAQNLVKPDTNIQAIG
jgi:hypothetical protein